MKDSTKNEALYAIAKAVFYMEQHYDEELTLADIAKVAGFSRFHFSRIFGFFMDESLNSYLRRIRLQQASFKFKQTTNITDVAMSIGYETSSAFAQAFKKQFQTTPTAFIQKLQQNKEKLMLEPQIVILEDIDIFYVRKQGPYATSMKQAWAELMPFAAKNNLLNEHTQAFGIGHDNPNITQEDKLRADACLSYTQNSIQAEGEVHKKIIKGGKHAMFLHKGSYGTLVKTYDQVTLWMSHSKETLAERPLFEKYLNRDPLNTAPEDLRTEIYVPLT